MESGELVLGAVFDGVTDDPKMRGPHRLLEVDVQNDLATIIAIPSVRKKPGTKQKNYYSTGFRRIRYSRLQAWLHDGTIRISTLIFPALWLMDDSELGAMLSRSPLKMPSELPALKSRDRKWQFIEPLIPVPVGTGKQQESLACIESLVKVRSAEVGVSKGQIFDALHRFYAFGCIRNSLLPNRIGRCGNPGDPRFGKNGKKLGRKNAAAKQGDEQLAGLILTEDDILNIQDSYKLIKPGTTVRDAYQQMNAMFYSVGNTLQHGHMTPILLPAHQRPTFDNFAYHGPRGKDGVGAARRLMGEGEWLKNLRPLIGTARDGVIAIGQGGSIDASPTDVHNVACFNPTLPIGVGRAVFLREIYSGLFLGWTTSIGNPTVEDAKLAILRGAETKELMLKKYDVNLPIEDFPAIFFSKYHADNGELRCKDSFISIVGGMKGGLEFIPTGRPDLNSLSESGHSSRHKGLDFRLAGTTRGRQRKRGEKPPVDSAVLSRYSYMRLLIHWAHWYNCHKQLELTDIPIEMQRDFASRGVPVPRTRIGIFRWAMENGYVAGQPVDLTLLRAHLLPRLTASIRRDGLILHRPGVSGAVELLHGAKFNHPYLAESGLMREAMQRTVSHIDVRVDPDELSAVYIVDRFGIHRIPNIKNDAILVREGCVADLCSMNDEQRLSNVYGASKVDQDECDFATVINETVRADKARKKAAEKQAVPVAPGEKINVRKAQAMEKTHLLDASLNPASQIGEPIQVRPFEATQLRPNSADASNRQSPKLTSLEERRVQRILGFMDATKE